MYLHHRGPAPHRLPLAAIGLSTAAHVLILAAVAAALMWTSFNRPKTYMVNLVPAVPAVGLATAPPAPSSAVRAPAPTPVPTPAPTPLPPRPVSPREPAAKEPAPKEPVRLPDPSFSTPRLPSRPALPRPGEKELPPLAGPRVASAPPLPKTDKVERPPEARPSPGATLGQPTGSPAGVGALSVNVSDFPYAWYLRQVAQKVEAEWKRQNRLSEPNQRPLLYFEIQRDGSIRLPKVKESSGNASYDQAALRAVIDASPFPPLPQDWTRPALGVDLRFFLSNPG